MHSFTNTKLDESSWKYNGDFGIELMYDLKANTVAVNCHRCFKHVLIMGVQLKKCTMADCGAKFKMDVRIPLNRPAAPDALALNLERFGYDPLEASILTSELLDRMAHHRQSYNLGRNQVANREARKLRKESKKTGRPLSSEEALAKVKANSHFSTPNDYLTIQKKLEQLKVAATKTGFAQGIPDSGVLLLDEAWLILGSGAKK